MLLMLIREVGSREQVVMVACMRLTNWDLLCIATHLRLAKVFCFLVHARQNYGLGAHLFQNSISGSPQPDVFKKPTNMTQRGQLPPLWTPRKWEFISSSSASWARAAVWGGALGVRRYVLGVRRYVKMAGGKEASGKELNAIHLLQRGDNEALQ